MTGRGWALGRWTFLLMVGCGAGTPRAEQTSAEPEVAPESAEPTAEPGPVRSPEFVQADADEAHVFSEDAEITVPAGWYWAAGPGGTMLVQSPEQDVRVIFLDGRFETDEARDEAFDGGPAGLTTATWRRIDPTFERPVESVLGRPATRGWTSLHRVNYQTDPSEERAVLATVHVRERRAVFALINATADGLGRRGAQLNQLVESLRVPGVSDEAWLEGPRRTLDAAAIETLAARIEAERVAAGVVGAAVVLVRGEQVLLARGMGERVQGGAPVTPSTLFMIGSTTKALTSLLAARLVSRGRLRWDQPVVELLPMFRFSDPARSAEVTIAHTLCACTGLPRRDLEFIFEFTDSTPESWLAMLGTMAPTTDFGETFQYSNLLVAAGGFAIARAVENRPSLSQSFARALDREILRPLGMRATTLDSRVARRREHAEPHARLLDDAVHTIPPDVEGFVTEIAPAGGAWSNVEDLAKYLQMELRSGELPRGRLMEEEPLMRRRAPGVAVGRDLHYGLGLMVGRPSGVERAGHGGNTIGFTSEMVFFPEIDLGFAVLANVGNANDFTRAVDRMIMEAVFEIPREAEARAATERVARAEALARLAGAIREPTRAEYTPLLGRYRSAELGPLELRVERVTAEDVGLPPTTRVDGTRLIADVGEWTSRVGLHTSEGGTVRWVLLDAPGTGLPMRVDGTSLVIAVPQHDYVFERVPAVGGGGRVVGE